jgi:hypothetical protein
MSKRVFTDHPQRAALARGFVRARHAAVYSREPTRVEAGSSTMSLQLRKIFLPVTLSLLACGAPPTGGLDTATVCPGPQLPASEAEEIELKTGGGERDSCRSPAVSGDVRNGSRLCGGHDYRVYVRGEFGRTAQLTMKGPRKAASARLQRASRSCVYSFVWRVTRDAAPGTYTFRLATGERAAEIGVAKTLAAEAPAQEPLPTEADAVTTFTGGYPSTYTFSARVLNGDECRRGNDDGCGDNDPDHGGHGSTTAGSTGGSGTTSRGTTTGGGTTRGTTTGGSGGTTRGTTTGGSGTATGGSGTATGGSGTATGGSAATTGGGGTTGGSGATTGGTGGTTDGDTGGDACGGDTDGGTTNGGETPSCAGCGDCPNLQTCVRSACMPCSVVAPCCAGLLCIQGQCIAP